jgi:elongation factor P
MISTADFRNGVVVEIENDLLEIIEFQHVKPGKGGAFVRTKYRNVLTGRVIEKTYRSGEKFEEARLESSPWQYLYHDGDVYHFMDPQTFEQIGVNANVVGDFTKWTKENDVVTLTFHKEKVIKVECPAHVNLVIAQSDPGLQGDRSSGGTKPATLETGTVIQVPLFVSEGELVRVDTREGKYIERVNK